MSMRDMLSESRCPEQGRPWVGRRTLTAPKHSLAAVTFAGARRVAAGSADAIARGAWRLACAALSADRITEPAVAYTGADAVAPFQADIVAADLSARGRDSAVAYAGAGAVASLSAVSVAGALTACGVRAAVAYCCAGAVSGAGGYGITGTLTQAGLEIAVALAGAQTHFAGNALLGAAIFAAVAGDSTVALRCAHAVTELAGQHVTRALCRGSGNATVALAGA